MQHETIKRLQAFFTQSEIEPPPVLAPLHKHLDSIAMLNFIVFIEQEFAITVDDSEATPTNFATLESVAIFIIKKTAA